jgi:peptide/nickel transport system substrate-binding protein
MGKKTRLGALAGVLVLVAASAAAASLSRSSQSDTFVFGASADPTTLDAPFISDGESFRAVNQIVETLIGQVPGTTKLKPLLATSWVKSAGGKRYTFKLRSGVRFHDGTPFNAAAVCANFNRWYNFTGAQQSSSASYYYNVIFGGFKKPEKGGPGPAKGIYRSCQAKGATTVVINLRRIYGAFLNALTVVTFGIQSPTAMQKYGADKGKLTSDGVYQPLGDYGVPGGVAVGTGAFKLQSWRVGDRLVLVRNDSYWGRDARLRQVILRAIADNAARLQALQTGEIQGYDDVEPQDIRTIQRSKNLKVLDRPPFNVGYVGFNQAVKPFDKLLVRQAVAYGLDRARVVKGFYAGRGVIAKEFQPPSLQYGYSNTVPTYSYNPAKSRKLLQQAGLTLPVKVQFAYPTNVARPYMPDPKRNFQAFAASLEKAGFDVTPKALPWSPDYLGQSAAGKVGALYLLGWTGDYGDPSTFLDGIFEETQFGLDNALGKRFYAMLDAALAQPDQDLRSGQYKRAENFVMRNLLGVPYVHTKPALAFAKNVVGYIPAPTLNDKFDTVRFTS